MFAADPIRTQPLVTRDRQAGGFAIMSNGRAISQENICWVTNLPVDRPASELESDIRRELKEAGIDLAGCIIQKFGASMTSLDQEGSVKVHARLAFESREICVAASAVMRRCSYRSQPNRSSVRTDSVTMSLRTCFPFPRLVYSICSACLHMPCVSKCAQCGFLSFHVGLRLFLPLCVDSYCCHRRNVAGALVC
jgi:hypothetical protein